MVKAARHAEKRTCETYKHYVGTLGFNLAIRAGGVSHRGDGSKDGQDHGCEHSEASEHAEIGPEGWVGKCRSQKVMLN